MRGSRAIVAVGGGSRLAVLVLAVGLMAIAPGVRARRGASGRPGMGRQAGRAEAQEHSACTTRAGPSRGVVRSSPSTV